MIFLFGAIEGSITDLLSLDVETLLAPKLLEDQPELELEL
jgi:hypothetical protein